MKFFQIFSLVLMVLLIQQCRTLPVVSRYPDIAQQILANRQAIANSPVCKNKQCTFLTFWDFDGTIIKGDCSDGLSENGKIVYRGIIDLAIEKGLSKKYQAAQGREKLYTEYEKLAKKDKKQALVHLALAFSGTREQDMLKLAQKHFQTKLKNYYFRESFMLLQQFKQVGIQSIVISASADFIVKGSQKTIPVAQIHGIRIKTSKGIIDKKAIEPVTYAEGKRERLQQILDEYGKKGPVFILAGLGNSYHTDAKFLQYIAKQKLPAGKPMVVMINGGTPPVEYQNAFKKVEFQKVVIGK